MRNRPYGFEIYLVNVKDNCAHFCAFLRKAELYVGTTYLNSTRSILVIIDIPFKSLAICFEIHTIEHLKATSICKIELYQWL